MPIHPSAQSEKFYPLVDDKVLTELAAKAGGGAEPTAHRSSSSAGLQIAQAAS
jgi:hypothetical protein